MKTNKWILGGLMAMAITACTSDELVENTNPTLGKKVTVTAYAPGDKANSRVSFTDDNTSKVTLSWKDSESFSVVYNTSVGTFSKSEEGNTFTGILPYNNENNQSNYYAVYPALSANTSLTTANTVPFDLSTQTGALDESMTYMRASSESGLSYSFQHCTAILKATFVNIPEGAKISKVVVKTSHADSKVDGNLDLTTGTISGGSKNTITINYTTAVDASTPVYIYLPPMAAAKKALTFTVTTEDEKQYTGTLAGSNDNGIVAGMVYKAEVAVAERAVTGYLTFTAAAGGQTLKMNTAVSGLQYSTDGENWTDLGTDPVNFNGNNQLFLRGKSSTGTNTATISFGDPNVKVACSGDIRTLVNYENFKEITAVDNAKFRNLFAYCKVLTSAPELPFTTLAQSCYSGMFYGCTSLTEAPALPATTLANNCYDGMFSGCKALITAPALPATTLQKQCYDSMFSGCTALTTAPALPATTLAEYCYYEMFSGCTLLATAPALPATTLSWYCYDGMFSGCTSLTTAPALPATTLQNECYDAMFENCTSLTTAPELPATTLAEKCCQNMFKGCTSLTEAPELNADKLQKSCYYGMFSGCTSLTEAPELPATTLAEKCCQNMFKGCTSLTEAPALPATTLQKQCYDSMFSGCTALTTAPALPATTLAEYCYYGMFSGCTSLTEAPELNAENLQMYCYQSMFSGCTALTTAPALPATTLAAACYYDMFYGCTSLTEAPALPATTLAQYCYCQMFENCTSLTEAPALPATTLAAQCYSEMFYLCRNLNKVIMLATDISATNCLYQWLMQVPNTSDCTFIKAKDITIPRNESGIPSNWTVVDVENVSSAGLNNFGFGGHLTPSSSN